MRYAIACIAALAGRQRATNHPRGRGHYHTTAAASSFVAALSTM